jgi:hypothetical protein
MISGATTIKTVDLAGHTPIGTPHDSNIAQRTCLCRNSEIRQLYHTLFRREDIRTLDIAMNDTLFMQVDEPLQDLIDVQRDEIFGEFSKILANAMQRTVFTVSPASVSPKGDVVL